LNLGLHDEKPTSNHLNYRTDIGLRPSGIWHCIPDYTASQPKRQNYL
jgi:hypothetical protein